MTYRIYENTPDESYIWGVVVSKDIERLLHNIARFKGQKGVLVKSKKEIDYIAQGYVLTALEV